MQSLNKYILEKLIVAKHNRNSEHDEDPLQSVKKFIEDNYDFRGDLSFELKDDIYVVTSDANHEWMEVKNKDIETLTNGLFVWGDNEKMTFRCEGCKNLVSLDGAPQKCDLFSCNDCHNLTSLEGAPQKCDGFYCKNCGLTSLKGAPKVTGNSFVCDGNPLKNLVGAPKHVGKYSSLAVFSCKDCKQLTSLKGSPKNVSNFIIDGCTALTNLKGAPKYSDSYYNFSLQNCTNIKSLEGCPEKVISWDSRGSGIEKIEILTHCKVGYKNKIYV